MEIQNEQNKSVTMQIRADETTRAQFADICKSLNLTQGAAMQQLIHAYELEQAKGALVGSADVIDDVRSHMDAVVNAFLVQLEHNANTNERYKQEYQERLESKEKALIDSQQQAQQARETAEQAQAALDAVTARAEQESKDAAAQIATYMEQAEHAKKEAETERQAAAAARRTADAMTARVDEVTEDRNRLKVKAEQVDNLTTELKQAQAEVTRLETSAQVAAAQAETVKAQAVADAERAMQTKLDEVRNKMQDKQDALRNKLDAVLDELAKIKDELHRTQTERDELARKIPQQTKSGNE